MLDSILKKIEGMGEVYSPGNASLKGHLYNPIPFPEFKHIPSQREAVYERLELIKPHAKKRTLLDIGCHTGFNCFMFEREGFECTGIESHHLTCEIANSVAEYKKTSSKFIEAKVSPEIIESLGKFNTILFLSTFQWVTADRGFSYATKVLKKAIEYSDVLFFETSMGGEGKAKMPMLPTAEAVKDYLSEMCHAEILGEVVAPGGKSHPRRVIFKCN